MPQYITTLLPAVDHHTGIYAWVSCTAKTPATAKGDTCCLAGCCSGFPIPWLLLAFLVWYLVNLYLFPPKPKGEPAAASTQE